MRYDKQDCESRVFKRLATRIKKKYQRLPICLLGDSIDVCDPIFDLCKEFNWRYIFRIKEGRIKRTGTQYI
jgi:hypothetical protein